MTADQLRTLFKDREFEYGEFEGTESPRSSRPDLNAMLLLDELCPGDSNIVTRARDEYYEFGLNVDLDDLAAVITEEQIAVLKTCGVMYDEASDRLTMFF